MKKNENNILDPDMLTEAIKEQTKDTINSIIGDELRKFLKEGIEDDDDEKANAEEGEPSSDTPAAQDAPEGDDPATDAPEGSGEGDPAGDDPVGDEKPEEGEDEWPDVPSSIDDYKVGDGEYDFTGEKDDEKLGFLPQVFKAMSNDDELVVVQQDNGDISLKDNGTGAEYLIKNNGEAAKEGSEETAEKEPMFEINLSEENLGYTDDYQSKNPVDGKEPYDTPTPNKTNNWDAGAPNSKEKPWAGPSEKEGDPYVKEGEEPIFELALGECGIGEDSLEEGADTNSQKTVRMANKSDYQKHRPNGPAQVAKVDSTANGINEDVLKKLSVIEEENKVLKSSLVKFRKALNEALVTNANVGLWARLVIENSTSTEEKVKLLKRFKNEAKTLEQGKALFESINNELKTNKTSAVIIDKPMKLEQTAGTINENKIYEGDESVNESIDLMKRMGLLNG